MEKVRSQKTEFILTSDFFRNHRSLE
jgi:hypothetical protein